MQFNFENKIDVLFMTTVVLHIPFFKQNDIFKGGLLLFFLQVVQYVEKLPWRRDWGKREV